MLNHRDPPALLPIEELNRLPPAQLGPALRPLFEAAAPLVDRLAAGRPYRSYAALLDHAERVVQSLDAAARVEVINAHPRIGERPDAVRRLSALSYREQGYDREAARDAGTLAQVYRDLDALNRAYEDRHGFRFVVFVNGRAKAEIVPVLRARLARPTEEEQATALRELLAIARDRLRRLSADRQASPAPSSHA